MGIKISYVTVRPIDERLIGGRVDGLRLWHRRGSLHDLAGWFEGVLCVCQNMVVPPGFASKLVGVSTETLRERVRGGRLSAFDFSIGDSTGRYRFVSLREIDQWIAGRRKWGRM